ncbi:hypothetical protein [Effusibacillus consociatus]
MDPNIMALFLLASTVGVGLTIIAIQESMSEGTDQDHSSSKNDQTEKEG